MKLEPQVCPLALGRRLKELGVEQDSQFYWVEHPITHEYDLWFGEVLWCGEDDPNRKRPIKHVSAFTVAELGEMLPAAIDDDVRTYRLRLTKDAVNHWDVRYIAQGDGSGAGPTAEPALLASDSPSLAGALARLLMHLLEYKLWSRAI